MTEKVLNELAWEIIRKFNITINTPYFVGGERLAADDALVKMIREKLKLD